MNICINETREINGREAALKGAYLIKKILSEQDSAAIILATGASQFELISNLITMDIDWSRIEIFHLDEYIDIPVSHPASFRKYLKERFADRVPSLKAFHYINGDSQDKNSEISRINELISRQPIDVAFVGIGENGHLAFNDPPADFETEVPYLIVQLDSECRKQQFDEGWFESLNEVPEQAISMSIRQIMKSTHIINTVPDTRKARAVTGAVLGDVSNLCPASILQKHKSCFTYLDRNSASLLSFIQ